MNITKDEKDVGQESVRIEEVSESETSKKQGSELFLKLKDAYKTRLSLRREKLAKSIKKTHLLRNNRREIARIKTAIHTKISKE